MAVALSEEHLEARAALLECFEVFVEQVFHTLHPGNDAWEVPNHVRLMCETLSEFREDDGARLAIAMPPRNLKSIVCSIAYPAWVLAHDPTHKFMVVSYSAALPEELSRLFRLVLQSPTIRTLLPEIDVTESNEGVAVISTREGGQRRGTSMRGSATGFGCDTLILDDPMKADDAVSQAARDREFHRYQNTFLSRLNNKKTGRVLIVSQRLNSDDFIGRVQRNPRFKILSLPAIAERQETHEFQSGETWQREPGDPLCAEHEDIETLRGLELDLGQDVFAAQYQQAPVQNGGGAIKIEWLGRYEKLPDRDKFELVVISGDVAASERPGASFSAFMVFVQSGGAWYVAEVMRVRRRYTDLKDRVLALHRRWRPQLMLIENASLGTALIDDLRQELSISRSQIGPCQPSRSKVERMEMVSAYLRDHEFLLPKSASWLDDLESELREFPESTYSDQVDALSQFLNVLKSRRVNRWLDRDPISGRRRSRRKRSVRSQSFRR